MARGRIDHRRECARFPRDRVKAAGLGSSRSTGISITHHSDDLDLAAVAVLKIAAHRIVGVEEAGRTRDLLQLPLPGYSRVGKAHVAPAIKVGSGRGKVSGETSNTYACNAVLGWPEIRGFQRVDLV